MLREDFLKHEKLAIELSNTISRCLQLVGKADKLDLTFVGKSVIPTDTLLNILHGDDDYYIHRVIFVLETNPSIVVFAAEIKAGRLSYSYDVATYCFHFGDWYKEVMTSCSDFIKSFNHRGQYKDFEPLFEGE